MQLTRQQFASCAPSATPATVDALFALNADNQPTIHRILAESGITEPAVVAQFITCAHLASYGFTNFDRPIYGLSVIDWFAARAREWHDERIGREAAEWNWAGVLNHAGTLFGVPVMPYIEVHDTLAAICAALGVEDRSEEFAIEGDGYDMQ